MEIRRRGWPGWSLHWNLLEGGEDDRRAAGGGGGALTCGGRPSFSPEVGRLYYCKLRTVCPGYLSYRVGVRLTSERHVGMYVFHP